MTNPFKGKLLKWSIIGLILIALIGLSCLIIPKLDILNTATLKNVKSESDGISPESFLKLYGLNTTGNIEKFDVVIPSTWDVNAGDYPVGLYWELANEFSKDAGLDITKLKGKTIEAWRYTLADGLPGQKEQSNFNYPSTVVLLVNSNEVEGAWLNFNTTAIGPSVKKRYLTDITGITFEEWVYKKGLFSNLGENTDLATLSPSDLLKEYFKAIRDGNKTRAYACLSPNEMLESLTMNFRGQGLYNSGFNQANSQAENIINPEPLTFRLFDMDNPEIEIDEIGNKSEIEIAVTMNVKWRNEAFNSPDGKETRFAVLNKYKNGWKLEGLGTGP